MSEAIRCVLVKDWPGPWVSLDWRGQIWVQDFIPKRSESRDSNRYLSDNIFCSIFHKSPKVEATPVPTGRWVDEPKCGLVFSHKKERFLIPPNIVQGETSQTQDDKHVWFHLHELPRKGEFMEMKSELEVTKRRENGELVPNGSRAVVCGNEKVLEIDSGDGCPTWWK